MSFCRLRCVTPSSPLPRPRSLASTPIFVTGMVPYMDAVAGAAGGAMEGPAILSHPSFMKTPPTRKGESKRILDAYAAKHGKAMEPQAQLGYIFADLAIKGMEACRQADLTTASFVAATEAMAPTMSIRSAVRKVSFSADRPPGRRRPSSSRKVKSKRLAGCGPRIGLLIFALQFPGGVPAKRPEALRSSSL